jgi:two-component system, chemotaxis family, sensor kinase CheA
MNLDEALQTFFAECEELLQQMEDSLLRIEREADKAETIGAIFRAAHTIKGSAGLFGLDHLVAFTHVLESVLDRVRAGEVGMDADLVALFLRGNDHIGMLVDQIKQGRDEPDAATRAAGEAILSALRAYLGATAVPATAASAVAVAEANAGTSEDRVGSEQWHISLRFGPNVFRNGLDPLSFLRYLATLGKIAHLETIADGVPGAAEMDPESCYLGFEIGFLSRSDKRSIEAVFDFVRDDCNVNILPPRSQISAFTGLLGMLPEEDLRIGELLLACGTLTRNELDKALQIQAREAKAEARSIGEILVGEQMVQPAVVDAAAEKQKQIKDRKHQESGFLRVDAEKLDYFINLIGELVIAGAGADLIARRSQNAELREATSKLSCLVEEVRDCALQLRMVKIGATFNRLQRVVRDVSKELDKDIGLTVAGEDTELDKTVVEKIGDPLMHLVRNAMDHGIEAADVRLARGKPAKGTVSLNAYHESGSIVIEVSDDGGGLKREKILAKGIERGLVGAGENLSDGEIFGLIFEAGFSTADQVTNLSGRGVGMDVVKRNITALRGTVDVASEEGKGTTVTVRLPLTLAIINGFLVSVGNAVFVVPLDMIVECVEFAAEEGHDFTNLRGEVLPFIRLRRLFEAEGEAPARENIVVVLHAGQKFGLVVDTLLGEFQTVIKPLGRMFSHVTAISGSTILGSGEVALILDVPILAQQAAGETVSSLVERRQLEN